MSGFSTFLGAVRPKDLTDQYKILAALYSLNATREPIAVRDVNKLLKLHFNTDVPKNVSASLRKYKRFVEPDKADEKLKWRLTTQGVDRLRELSGLPLKSVAAVGHEADVGIVCALDHPELTAVIEAMGGAAAWQDVDQPHLAHLYRETSLVTLQGTALRVVATTSTSMGLTAAAIATTQLIQLCRPRLVMMIGIAAGTAGSSKEFGDVLVADPSVDYNSGKVVMEDGIRGFLPDPYPIGLNARFRSVLQKHRRPDSLLDQIRSRWQGSLPPHPNRLHIGPLGAADQVIDDATRVFEIQKNWRKLIGVEMETYGVYRACHEAPEPKPRFVSFKSVCDFAAQKTDSWQPYAAFTAANFATDFLKTDWEVLWPTEE